MGNEGREDNSRGREEKCLRGRKNSRGERKIESLLSRNHVSFEWLPPPASFVGKNAKFSQNLHSTGKLFFNAGEKGKEVGGGRE